MIWEMKGECDKMRVEIEKDIWFLGRENGMTEKEKMMAGMIYDANYDEELLKERMKAKDLCFEYNYLIKPSEVEKQNKILKKLLGKTGKNFTMTAPFWCDYGYNIELGENFYSNHNVVILDGAKVKFGDNVFKPITVGNNVWFGAGVHVMPGVTIGNDVVIAAGSVVTKDIPSGVVAAGVPCRVVKKITEQFIQ